MADKEKFYKGCWVQDKAGVYGTVKRCPEHSDWIYVDFASHNEWVRCSNLKIVEARTL
ncbi:hypothetical protein QE450_000825 [Paenibacillus sp. SORGH_AS306]|uniref:hypothetical protein n=1 Tax=unclassified Paenibacillus TaxID=185978 RepID=UPI00277E7570|nr:MULTISPECIES: hypothetical protein [unclassified Paenibacillus]MDQ1233327.1 hypothetical protein [Paenibacillus sp. SORGH_AS_0306]MDR6110368.1 hypothetical protein [Paenibacillus sp. SORGH_AS_0338]